MELEKALRGRRSIRRFKDKKVGTEKIREIIRAGTLAPSACNRQHWEFIIINDEKVKERIYKEGGTQPLILKAPTIIATLYHREINLEHHANIQSVSAAVQNMLLRAYELGLGTTWMAGFGNEKKVREILNAPSYLRILCFILLGYPNEKPNPPRRKPLDEIIHFEKFSEVKEPLPKTCRPSKWTIREIKENQKLIYRSKYRGEDRELWGNNDIEKIYEILKDNVNQKRKNKILNLFAYDGTILRKIEDLFKGDDVYTIELTKEACEIIDFKLKGRANCGVYQEGIPFKDNFFDIIFMTFSLEKIPDREKILKEAMNVLKPDGKLIIFFKNKISPFGIMYMAMEKFIGVKDMSNFFISPDPFEPVSVFSLRNSLNKRGFDTKLKELTFLQQKLKIITQK